MGADLYIESITDVARKKWKKKLDEVCGDRNDKDGKKFDYYWNKMYPATGYFRDSYNDSNLLWKFGISYWTDINQLVNKRGFMTVPKAKILLELLDVRKNIFKKNIRNLKTHGDIDEVAYFKKKYKRLRGFLNNAVKLNSSIRCSL